MGPPHNASGSDHLRVRPVDLDAAVHYTATVGNGFVDAGRKLQYCDTALKAALFVVELGFPFLASPGKASTLFGLKRDAAGRKRCRGLERTVPVKTLWRYHSYRVVAGTAAVSHDQPKRSDLPEVLSIPVEMSK